MADLFDNPMGLMGFEFVEFASPTPNVLEPLFVQMGFSLVARHRSKDVLLFRQGEINFIVNREPRSPAAYFAAEHGPCACGSRAGCSSGCRSGALPAANAQGHQSHAPLSASGSAAASARPGSGAGQLDGGGSAS